jgi:hypothetical protein
LHPTSSVPCLAHTKSMRGARFVRVPLKAIAGQYTQTKV